MQLGFSIHKEGSGTAAITPSSPPHRAAGSGNKETIDSPDVCVRRTGWRGESVLEANTASAARLTQTLNHKYKMHAPEGQKSGHDQNQVGGSTVGESTSAGHSHSRKAFLSFDSP